MSGEYEGNPSAICMNQRKGECAGLGGRCPCEDFRPTYLISPEDAQILFPGARDRSINPGGIHYKSRHTRTAGEHRYPREDIVIDTYGNKLIGGYLDNYKSENVEKNDKLKGFCKQHPKISLLCSHCGEKKRFKTEDLLARDVFVYECRSCSGRNSFRTSKIAYDSLDSVELIYKTERYIQPKSSSSKVYKTTPDGKQIHLANISKKQRKFINKFKNECIFNIDANICVYTGLLKSGDCRESGCKYFLCIENEFIDFEKFFTDKVLPHYNATLDKIAYTLKNIKKQKKKCTATIKEWEAKGLPFDERTTAFAIEESDLKEEAKMLQETKYKISCQRDSILSLVNNSNKTGTSSKLEKNSKTTIEIVYKTSAKEKSKCMYYCVLVNYCLRDGETREGRPYACAELACPHFDYKKGNEQQYENLIEQELKEKCIERLKFIEEEIARQEAETLKLSRAHCDAIERDASKSEKDKCANNVRQSIEKTDQLKKEYESTQKSLEKINKYLIEFRKKKD